MSSRSSIILDEESRRAARELALRYDCSTSEAIRRAIVAHRDSVLGVSAQGRAQRREVLARLFDLFADNDPTEEVARLKREDDGS